MRYIEQNPRKAKMVKTLKEYPYSSYHHFFKQTIPECLQNAWIVQNHKENKEAIQAMLENSVDIVCCTTRTQKSIKPCRRHKL
jgi:hypothetical protein